MLIVFYLNHIYLKNSLKKIKNTQMCAENNTILQADVSHLYCLQLTKKYFTQLLHYGVIELMEGSVYVMTLVYSIYRYQRCTFTRAQTHTHTHTLQLYITRLHHILSFIFTFHISEHIHIHYTHMQKTHSSRN